MSNGDIRSFPFSEKFSLAFASMEILCGFVMKHFGRFLLSRKSFCIDEPVPLGL